jgi:hypothetical protein
MQTDNSPPAPAAQGLSVASKASRLKKAREVPFLKIGRLVRSNLAEARVALGQR